jgi:hypothetical protein
VGALSDEGWVALADYLRALRDSRWASLPPEATAEEVWPTFQKAVAAALADGRARGRIALDRGRSIPPGEGPAAHDPPANGSA